MDLVASKTDFFKVIHKDTVDIVHRLSQESSSTWKDT